MEKTLRVLGGDEDEGAGHSHSHSHAHANGNGSAEHEHEHAAGHSTGVSASASAGGLKSRTSGEDGKSEADDNSDASQDKPKQTSKLSAYLNLFGDFVHNMYASHPSVPSDAGSR